MAVCDSCGNDYDAAFTVTRGDQRGTFDSFECAINVMAPQCATCGTKVIGHGVQANGTIYCCANCAEQQGASGLSDRA